MTGNQKNSDNFMRTILYHGVVALFILFVFNIFFNPFKVNNISYSEFERLGSEGKIEKVQISSDKIYFFTKSEESKKSQYFITDKIDDPNLLVKLKGWDIKEYGAVPTTRSPLADFFKFWILPFIIFFILSRFFTKNLTKNNPLNFGRSNAKEYNIEKNTGISFADVAGQEEAKNSLKEIVNFLHNPTEYLSIGAKLPKGVLLVGSPGTGKTLLARAVAGEAGVPFFSITGSEFVQMFVGMGAARVRDLFKEAKKKSPCIVFIDEIDAIGKSRGYQMGSNDEREQTLNQLLSEMDGFDSSEKPIVILAATNRPEVLDEALLRPGRFDRRIIISKPDLNDRKKILEVHIKGVKMADDVNLDSIAQMTAGSSGADLANIINEAALRAVRFNRKTVIQQDLEDSIEVVFAGEAKKDRIMSKREKEFVAYHEAGHALTGALQKTTDPVNKITIVPTTMGALGYTVQLPTEEKYLISKKELEEKIVVMLAGRAAEEIKFNQITTGAANDIEKATQIARNMVTHYGMSEKFGMMGLESTSSKYIDGSNIKNYSSETGKMVDKEVLSIIKDSHQKATKLLTENIDLLDKIAKLLLDKETITGKEFYKILESHKD